MSTNLTYGVNIIQSHFNSGDKQWITKNLKS